MALASTWQLYLDSLHGPLSKFQFTRPHLFRYSSSSSNPLRKSRFIGCEKPSCGNDRKDSTLDTSDWFPVWNKPIKDSRPKPPRAFLDYDDEDGGGDGRGRTMERIVEKLRKSGYVDDGDGDERGGRGLARGVEKGSVEEIFYVEEDGMLPNSRGGFSKDSRLGVETLFESDGEVRFPWEKPKEEEEQGGGEKWTAKSKSRTFLAELTLPDSELKRLRNLTYQTKSRVKIKGAGVTEEVVSTIRDKWKSSEIVRVKVDGAPALNMKKVHEILERKTGGLVVWRSGTSIALYRGVSYVVPSVHQNKKIFRRNEIVESFLPIDSINTLGGPTTVRSAQEIRNPNSDSENTAGEGGSSMAIEKKQIKSLSEVHYEDEIDKLLDGLGPRYMDWPGYEPLPVDADMLPGIVPGFQPPFRLLPYGVKPTLSQKDATSLRRLARVLPPHFALGRSRQLQGLAAAITKLWEKSLIAKIALKRGVQITTSERMAEDLKKLTGGLLLVRTKEFLVYYRGKSFLSPDVTEALLEKERLAKDLQDEEEQARLRASAFVIPDTETVDQPRTAGTLEETLDADSRWGKRLDDQHKEKIKREVEISKHNSLARKFAKKLAFAERRLKKAEDALSKVEVSLKPAELQADPDSITDEERFMFRKLGLRMKAFLLLGRRGVFDGTVENMHLHWKYRELVKIVLKAKNFEFVKKTALALEAESGGVLVSVDKISKGYAIIVFRGKDYKRPSTIRPKTLLTKRKALARAIEIQRREALLKHISAVQTQVEKLKAEMDKMRTDEGGGEEELFGKPDSTYRMDDDENDENEEEGYEAYLETYDNDDDDDADHGIDEAENGIPGAHHGNACSNDVQDQEVKTEYEDGEDEANIEMFANHNGGDNELRSDNKLH